MKLPDPEDLRLRDIFNPYIDAELVFRGIPLHEISSLKPGAPKEAQEAYEKWKKLEKKNIEEEAKIGIIF